MVRFTGSCAAGAIAGAHAVTSISGTKTADYCYDGQWQYDVR